MNEQKNFKSSFGFVLACVGSAVGMGNIWMFPYRLGQNGGAAFLIIYLFFIALFGTVGLSAEFAIGRRAQTGTLGSYEYCFNKIKKGKLGYILGWIPLLGSLGISIGYAVIVGWVLRSMFASLTGTLLLAETNSTEFFTSVTGKFGSLPWHTIVVVVAMLILLAGVSRGIEKINKILMPTFFALFVILAIRVATLPGAIEGYKFLFVPKWEALTDIKTWVYAMGQAFFSLSITGSGMIVYGAYLSKKEDIPKTSVLTGIFDTCAALIAALAIVPAVFAFGIEVNAGPPLMFITLPNVFKQMPLGRLFAVLFFLAVFFAGITSLINMFEAVCESWQNRFKIKRSTAIYLCVGICLAVGVFIEYEPYLGKWMDFITIIVVPFGAALGAISTYYILGFNEMKDEFAIGRSKPLPNWFGPVALFVYVPVAILVFILGIYYGGIG